MSRAWFVVQSEVRSERKAAAAIREAGFDTFLPIMRKDIYQRRSRRMVTREFLLFNRYFFAELPYAVLGDVYALDGVDCLLGSNDVPCPIKASDVEVFRQKQANLEFDDTTEARIRRKEIGRTRRETIAMRFAPGKPVRVKRGPFEGFAGMIKDVNGRGAVTAMIELFGRLQPVEFAPENVDAMLIPA